MNESDLIFLDQTIERLGRTPEAAIPILQAVQDRYRYLPEEILRRIVEMTQVTPAAIEGIASFYDMFRREPVGRHVIKVCHGTACHVKGSPLVEEAFRRELGIAPDRDTDAEGRFTIEQIACMGCCTLAPAVQIEQHTYGHVSPGRVRRVLLDFERQRARDGESRAGQPGNGAAAAPTGPAEIEIRVGLGSCCMVKGSDQLFDALHREVRRIGAPVQVKRVGCVGMCHRTPMVEVRRRDGSSQFYDGVGPAHARELVWRHARTRGWLGRTRRRALELVDVLLNQDDTLGADRHGLDVRDPAVRAFLDRQKHIATEHFGNADPTDLEEYRSRGGFEALRRSLEEWSQQEVIGAIQASGLRGRGGAGFPTGDKWAVVARAADGPKYVICNGDEGDPGAFMDRMLLESFPYRIIEGLAIAAVAVGAAEGYFYIRHEYPLAVRRIREAIARCEQEGILGARMLGSDRSLRLQVMEGAGAFVCGEETALISSLEGERGMPRLRPPYPAESGLWGRPTLVNNVETLAVIPWILRNGPESFAAIGTPTSKGTKVFALAGKVRRGGLIEVPMGLTIREIVQEIGGGVEEGRRFKAVQIGGPSGGCVPASLDHIPVDYEALRDVGAIMGSGGLVVLDDNDCMVDVARYFLQFTQNQSCGKCTFCRIGTRRMLDILDRLCKGEGQPRDLAELEYLAGQVRDTSLCGLGGTAPNPVLTTLRYFRDEYEAHLAGRCPAGRCTALIRYTINDRCIGCTLCAQHCPVSAIEVRPYRRHEIDQNVCTRCDVCRQVCRDAAIEVR